MPNPKSRFGLLLAELIFAKKIKSMFNKILPEWKAQKSMNILIKYINPEEKVLFKIYQKRKEFRKNCVVEKKEKEKINHMIYMVQGPRWEYKTSPEPAKT